MYDYKFRQSQLSFEKTRRPFSRLLIRATAFLVITAAVVYAVLNLGFTGKAPATNAAPESDVLPLSLPPPKAGTRGDPHEGKDIGRPTKKPDEHVPAGTRQANNAG